MVALLHSAKVHVVQRVRAFSVQKPATGFCFRANSRGTRTAPLFTPRDGFARRRRKPLNETSKVCLELWVVLHEQSWTSTAPLDHRGGEGCRVWPVPPHV